MVEFTGIFYEYLFLTLIFILSAIPLYITVKILRGKTTLFKTVFIAFISGIIVAAIKQFFEIWGGIIAFLILVWIYHESFRLKWWKAFFVWIIQLVVIAILLIILALIGISVGILMMFL